jgi:phosphate transport system substrate-binding protein
MDICRTFCMLIASLCSCALPIACFPQASTGVLAPVNCSAAEIHVLGAGSTTSYPLLIDLMNQYNRLHPGICISYRALGSKAGVRMLSNRTALFAVSEIPVADDQLALINGNVIQIPFALNAVVPIYSLPQVPKLRLSGGALANIFLGKITKWNDPEIAIGNPGINLPELNISVYHDFPMGNRHGTFDTTVFAEYLAKVSPAFNDELARNTDNWPLPSWKYKGATGALGFVHSTPGAIGYIWWIRSYVGEHIAEVKNFQGEYVLVSPQSVTTASASLIAVMRSLPSDFRVSIINAPGKASFPITSFAWILFYQNPVTKKEDRAFLDFLKWVLADGQKLEQTLNYPTLPEELVSMELGYLKDNTK